MPTVEKVAGGRVYIRSLEQTFEAGDQAEVSGSEAEYLCEERGDFRRIDNVTTVEFTEVEDDDEGDVNEITDASLESVGVDSAEDDAAAESDASDDATDAESDGADDVEQDSEATEGPHRDPDTVDEGKCGYYDPEEMDDPCSRTAGWGTDRDEGPCEPHADELEG